jgi:hypothetical protein
VKRNAIGKNGRQIKSAFADAWSTVPWLTTHRIGAHHGYRIDGAEQAQHHAEHASPGERKEAPTVAETTQELSALRAWEDEGGKIEAAGS